MRPREFLTWVADRLVYVHGDGENVDFVQKPHIAAEDLPADREELQKLLNAAYRKGNQDAHAARDILRYLVPTITGEEIMNHYRETCPVQYGVDDDLQAVEWCHKDCRWAYGLAISRINDTAEATQRRDHPTKEIL